MPVLVIFSVWVVRNNRQPFGRLVPSRILNNKEVESHESQGEVLAKQHRASCGRCGAYGIDNGFCAES